MVGTRLYVCQVISTLRGNPGDIERTADDFGSATSQIRAALAYYADFTDGVDADAAARLERQERERWERQQRAIA